MRTGGVKCPLTGIRMRRKTTYHVILGFLTLTSLALMWSFNKKTALIWTKAIVRSNEGELGVRTKYDKIQRTRLLCWVMTMKKNIDKRAIFVKETWGKQCDILLFIGSQGDDKLPLIKVNVTEGRSHLTEKTHASFRYAHEHYVDAADWFLKADDDTYVFMDNLKYYLSNYNTSRPIYFGFKFTGHTPNGYNSGGAGYVLSKEALKRFIRNGTNRTLCPLDGGVEDVAMGKCMHKLGVTLANTLDDKNRTTFHAYHPLTHLASSDPYLSSRSGYGFRKGAGNISSYPLTFHYLKGRELKLIDFLVHHVKHRSNEGTVNL